MVNPAAVNLDYVEPDYTVVPLTRKIIICPRYIPPLPLGPHRLGRSSVTVGTPRLDLDKRRDLALSRYDIHLAERVLEVSRKDFIALFFEEFPRCALAASPQRYVLPVARFSPYARYIALCLLTPYCHFFVKLLR